MIWNIFLPYWQWVMVQLDKLVGANFCFDSTSCASGEYLTSWITGDVYWNVWLVLMIGVSMLAVYMYRTEIQWRRWGALWSTFVFGTVMASLWPVVVWAGLVALFPLPVVLTGLTFLILATIPFEGYEWGKHVRARREKKREVKEKMKEVQRLKVINDPTYQESLLELEEFLAKEKVA